MTAATIEGRIEFTWKEDEHGWTLYAGQIGITRLIQPPGLKQRGDWWYVLAILGGGVEEMIEGLEVAKKDVLEAEVHYLTKMLSCD